MSDLVGNSEDRFVCGMAHVCLHGKTDHLQVLTISKVHFHKVMIFMSILITSVAKMYPDGRKYEPK